MRFVLASLALGCNAVDNLTTYMCLRRPVDGFEVYEANPLAAWGFGVLGLETGLAVEMLICVAATGFLLFSGILHPRLRLGLLVLMTVLPAGAALNNLTVMRELGIPWF